MSLLRARLILAFTLSGLSAIAALTVVAPRAAFAQDAALENARREFERGNDLFLKGDYQAAADAFGAAYAQKPFPAFLFNSAVCFEKLKDYPKAVEFFKKYLAEDPKAVDRADVEKRIKTIEDEIARAAAAPPPDPANPNAPAVPQVVLPEVKTKGVVVITSKPDGALIYIDDKKNGSVGETPWNGSLEGTHTIIVESKGYKTEKKKITPSPDKLYDLYFALSVEQNLGWLEVKSSIPGSDVFIDNKEVGSYGKTPWTGNVQPGKRKIWVSREGYTEYEGVVNIVAGKTHNLNVKLEEAAVGFVKIRVNETGTGARVLLDDKEVCAKAPCRFQAPEGSHVVKVGRGGKKTLAKRINIVRKTESTLSVKLAPKPSRTDAIYPFVFSVAFGVGGYFALDHASGLPETEDEDGPLGPAEEKNNAEKDLWTYGGYGALGLSGITFLTGCWYLVRDKGPPSSATMDSRDLSFAPAVGPGYAGFAAGGTW